MHSFVRRLIRNKNYSISEQVRYQNIRIWPPQRYPHHKNHNNDKIPTVRDVTTGTDLSRLACVQETTLVQNQ
jgi:hypothetical protein